MKVTSIRKKVLKLIFEASKAQHPNEFSSMLRAKKGVITELIIVPAISGNTHAIMFTHMLPVDFSVVGTIHSHPSPYPFPSEADLSFFSNRGQVHIIVAYPYDESSYRCYDREGKPLELEVL